MPRKQSRRAWLVHQIAEQQAWIEAHGGDLAGYVARYGSADDPKHYGDGGEAIYAADMANLQRLLRGGR